MNKIDRNRTVGYEQDYARWSADQAALLRAGRFAEIDVQNVAEEIESLGRSDRREIASRLTIILAHLLKWQFQPDKRTNSWAVSITANRDAIGTLIEESPSLKGYPEQVLMRAYRLAPLTASGETGLPLGDFPTLCPYSAAQVLDLDFWPA